MPDLARLGYPFDKAMNLPAWLFWDMVTTCQKDSIRERMAIFEAVGMAFGSFEKGDSKAISKDWRRALQAGYDMTKPEQTKEQRRKAWERIAKAAL